MQLWSGVPGVLLKAGMLGRDDCETIFFLPVEVLVVQRNYPGCRCCRREGGEDGWSERVCPMYWHTESVEE